MTMRRTIALAALVASLAACAPSTPAPPASTATVFEGARVITGDGGVVEDGVFVVDGGRFTAVGKRGGVDVPAGAAHVDLSGKTVMPTLVDLHGHFGFQNVPAGTMSKETYTRENLIDHLERLAYVGVGATIGVGDLVTRSDLKGGRTNWGDVPLKMRDEVVPGAALFKTAGPGMAWPGSGAQGHPSRMDVSYWVSTEAEARQAVQDYVAMKPEFIKIWVDDREGAKKTLTPDLIRAIADEVGATLLFDAAHLSGMIAGGAWPQPLDEGAHAMTMSTYKSLGGPPSGLIVTRDDALAEKWERIKRVRRVVTTVRLRAGCERHAADEECADERTGRASRRGTVLHEKPPVSGAGGTVAGVPARFGQWLSPGRYGWPACAGGRSCWRAPASTNSVTTYGVAVTSVSGTRSMAR